MNFLTTIIANHLNLKHNVAENTIQIELRKAIAELSKMKEFSEMPKRED